MERNQESGLDTLRRIENELDKLYWEACSVWSGVPAAKETQRALRKALDEVDRAITEATDGEPSH